MGCGSVNERRYYFYFSKGSDGGYTQGKVLAGNTTIYETTNAPPRLEWTMIRRDVPDWLSIDFLEGYEGVQGNYRLYVPTNTIIKEFKL